MEKNTYFCSESDRILSPVSTTRVDGPIYRPDRVDVWPVSIYPSTRTMLSGARFPLAELTGHVCSQLGPSTRLVETGLYILQAARTQNIVWVEAGYEGWIKLAIHHRCKKRFFTFFIIYKKVFFNVFCNVFLLIKTCQLANYVLKILGDRWFYCWNSVIERSIFLVCPLSGLGLHSCIHITRR